MSAYRLATSRVVPVLFALLVLGVVRPAAADGNQARAHYERGRSYFQVGEYRKAMDEFKAAHVEKNDPAYIYNIAECHRQLGESKEAVVFYRRFLGLSPPGHPLRPDAQRRIVELEAQPPPKVAEPIAVPPPARSAAPVAAPQSVPPPTPVPVAVQPPPAAAAVPVSPAAAPVLAPAPTTPPLISTPDAGPSPRTARRLPAYIVGTAALVALGVGTYFALDARSQWKDSDAHCPADLCDPEGDRLSRGARTSARVADVAFGAGLVAAGAAVWLYLRAGRQPMSAADAAPVAGRVRILPEWGAEGRAALTLASSW